MEIEACKISVLRMDAVVVFHVVNPGLNLGVCKIWVLRAASYLIKSSLGLEVRELVVLKADVVVVCNSVKSRFGAIITGLKRTNFESTPPAGAEPQTKPASLIFSKFFFLALAGNMAVALTGTARRQHQA